jgi:ABC-2 type transport system ATP-binding protein
MPAEIGAEPAGDDGRYTLTTDTPTESLHQLTGWAMENGMDLEELSVAPSSLEDVFVEIAEAARGEQVSQ